MSTETFGCRNCDGSGDLKWLVTHSHKHPARPNRLTTFLWHVSKLGGGPRLARRSLRGGTRNENDNGE